MKKEKDYFKYRVNTVYHSLGAAVSLEANNIEGNSDF